MDLALNNLQRLLCHKTQPTNQPTTIDIISFFICMSVSVCFYPSVSLSLFISQFFLLSLPGSEQFSFIENIPVKFHFRPFLSGKWCHIFVFSFAQPYLVFSHQWPTGQFFLLVVVVGRAENVFVECFSLKLMEIGPWKIAKWNQTRGKLFGVCLCMCVGGDALRI